MQRYLRKITDNTIWTHSEQLAKRTDMVPASEAEALWRAGKGPKPVEMMITTAIPAELLDKINLMKPEQMAEMNKALEMILNKQSALAYIQPVATAFEPETPVGATNEHPEGSESQMSDGTEEDEMEVNSLDKPPSHMNKGELQAYAKLVHKVDLDPEEMSKSDMYKAVKDLDEKAGK